MVIQVTGENSNSVSKFLALFTFRYQFHQDGNQISIHKCVGNRQIVIFWDNAENSYKKTKESAINMFFLFPSVFYQYLKSN